jgi:hypothetical protein
LEQHHPGTTPFSSSTHFTELEQKGEKRMHTATSPFSRSQGLSGRYPGWLLAFLLSAAVHALAVLGFTLLPGARPLQIAETPQPLLFVGEMADEDIGGSGAFVLPHLNPNAANKNSAEPRPPASPENTIDISKIQLQPTTLASGPPETTSKNPGAPPGGTAVNADGTGFGTKPGPGIGAGNGSGSFFRVAPQGVKIVYVIDRSSSMGKQGALTIASRELLASLQSLPELALFQIIVYNSTAHALIEGHPGWFQATQENKVLAAQALATLEATNGTVHHLALPLALALQPDTIFFLTDADDLDPGYLTEITRRNQGRAAIHVVELNTANRGRPEMPLQVFARENHGAYQAVDLGGAQ